MIYEILETRMENGSLKSCETLHRFKNKNEMIDWLIDNYNDTSHYFNLALVE